MINNNSLSKTLCCEHFHSGFFVSLNYILYHDINNLQLSRVKFYRLLSLVAIMFLISQHDRLVKSFSLWIEGAISSLVSISVHRLNLASGSFHINVQVTDFDSVINNFRQCLDLWTFSAEVLMRYSSVILLVHYNLLHRLKYGHK